MFCEAIVTMNSGSATLIIALKEKLGVMKSALGAKSAAPIAAP
jgi:hypothetical protein